MAGGPFGRVWIDDRHPIFRRGLVGCVAAGGFEVVGESAGFEPLPDASLFDLLVFEASPQHVRSAVQLVAQTDARLVALLPSTREDDVFDLIEAGATAVLGRADLGPPALLAALHAASAGNTSIRRDLIPRLLQRAANDGTNGASGSLSDRELAALNLVSQGLETREIAERMCYSERTVKNILHDLLVKTNCRNRAHVVAMAARQGLI